MKASLLGAHDVGGVSGVCLRARIRWKLSNEFYENPVNYYDATTFCIATFGLFMASIAYILMVSFSVVDVLMAKNLDLSATGNFLLFVAMWAVFIVLVDSTILLTYLSIDAGAPLVRRLGKDELQHASDEIDL